MHGFTNEFIRNVLKGSSSAPDRRNTILSSFTLWCRESVWPLITVNYRESYDLFAVSGIYLITSPLKRPRICETRKIANGVARVKLGKQESIELGKCGVKTIGGYAKDYVRAMWLMLQQDKPQDYVISTGETHSVKRIFPTCLWSCGYFWLVKAFWSIIPSTIGRQKLIC